jgi:hypothetical protein
MMLRFRKQGCSATQLLFNPRCYGKLDKGHDHPNDTLPMRLQVIIDSVHGVDELVNKGLYHGGLHPDNLHAGIDIATFSFSNPQTKKKMMGNRCKF